jgi:PadR family transcriptional regulator, regulatory protein PadR
VTGIAMHRWAMHDGDVAAMREPTYLILVALGAGERHGYGITQDVAELSEGRVKLGAGTLYGALDRLVDEGMVAATRSETTNGRLRRYYALTDQGGLAVRDETQHRLAVARSAATQLGLAGGLA